MTSQRFSLLRHEEKEKKRCIPVCLLAAHMYICLYTRNVVIRLEKKKRKMKKKKDKRVKKPLYVYCTTLHCAMLPRYVESTTCLVLLFCKDKIEKKYAL